MLPNSIEGMQEFLKSHILFIISLFDPQKKKNTSLISLYGQCSLNVGFKEYFQMYAQRRIQPVANIGTHY